MPFTFARKIQGVFFPVVTVFYFFICSSAPKNSAYQNLFAHSTQSSLQHGESIPHEASGPKLPPRRHLPLLKRILPEREILLLGYFEFRDENFLAPVAGADLLISSIRDLSLTLDRAPPTLG